MIFLWLYLFLFSPTIQPTYNCFENSIRYLQYLSIANPSSLANTCLIHGLCSDKNNDYGHSYFHSWVEVKSESETRCVYDVIYNGRLQYLNLPKPEFYEKFGVLRAKSYSSFEVDGQVYKAGHCGPWAQDPGVLTHQRFNDFVVDVLEKKMKNKLQSEKISS